MFQWLKELFKKEQYGLSPDQIEQIQKTVEKPDPSAIGWNLSCINVLLRNIEQQYASSSEVLYGESNENNNLIERIERRINTKLGDRVITWSNTVYDINKGRILKFEKFIYWDWDFVPLFAVKKGILHWDPTRTTLEGAIDAILEIRDIVLPCYPNTKLREMLIAEQKGDQ